jgi:hypothetical protein
VHEGGLSRSGDTGDGDEGLEREFQVHPLDVVESGPTEPEPFGASSAPPLGDGALAPPREIAAGDGVHLEEIPGWTLEHDLAPLLSRGRPQFHDVIRREDRPRVVLHHQYRVPQIPESGEEPQERIGVARVEPDRRLVQHVDRVDQVGPERVREVDPLGLSSGEGPGLSIQVEIPQSDVHQERDPGAQLPQDRLRDHRFRPLESERIEPGGQLVQGEPTDLRDVPALDPDVQGRGRTRPPPHASHSMGLWYRRRNTRMYCL